MSDEKPGRIESIAENSILKLSHRVLTPAFVALLLWLFQGVIHDINELERAQWKIFGEIENVRGVTQERLENLKSRVDRNELWIGEIWRKRITHEP